MSFPNTRHTLIQRLAAGGQAADWREFMADYWGPVCRFARWKGNLSFEDAEDVGSEVFAALLKSRLLERWSAVQAARLRTLMCAVVRNILSNRLRLSVGREHVVQEHGGQLDRYLEWSEIDAAETPREQLDAFYAAWVDDLLQSVLEDLLTEYHGSGRGDYFRVLYGRICDELTVPEIAEALNLKLTSAENYLRHMRQKLTERLRETVRIHVSRYSGPGDVDVEFTDEWNQLGRFLERYGGLEAVIRRLCQDSELGSRRFQSPGPMSAM